MENIEYIKLFDIYGKLLTDKQQKTFEMYYMSDLSLREIAENLDVSFQSVRNCLNNCKKKLNSYENNLNINTLLNNLKKINNIEINNIIEKYNKGNLNV